VLKFAFLRALAGADRTLGIAWYYAPGEMDRFGSGGRQDKSFAVVGRFLLVRSMGYGDSRRTGLLALFGNSSMISVHLPSSVAFG
jgi:hypothetical protein